MAIAVTKFTMAGTLAAVSTEDRIGRAFAAMLAQPVPENTLMAYSCAECGAITGLRWENGPVAGDPERHFRWHDEQFEQMNMED